MLSFLAQVLAGDSDAAAHLLQLPEQLAGDAHHRVHRAAVLHHAPQAVHVAALR